MRTKQDKPQADKLKDKCSCGSFDFILLQEHEMIIENGVMQYVERDIADGFPYYDDVKCIKCNKAYKLDDFDHDLS